MKEFYKILHEDQKHYGIQYHLGLNEDIEPFDEKPYCGGGIFFSEKEHVLEYLTYAQGTKLAIIEIPEEEKIVKVGNKFKAHQIIIKEIKDLWTNENYEWFVSYFGIDNLFQYACKNGALSFAKELDKNHKVDIHTKHEYAFQWACNNGHLEVAKWLHKLGANIHEANDEAFRLACANGYLEVAKWLYSLGGVDIHAYGDTAFRLACANGCLEVAKWLYDFGDVNIHAKNDIAFRWSCANGHLEVAKWLHSLGGVDIHANNEYNFRWSCINGHLEVAKWLHDLGDVDIYAKNDHIFKISPKEIITWLNTL